MRRVEGARTDKAPTQESSVEEGDPLSESYLLEIPKNLPVPTRNENTEMMYEYGGREGVARVLSVFKKWVASRLVSSRVACPSMPADPSKAQHAAYLERLYV
jgi:hypothetical protein